MMSILIATSKVIERMPMKAKKGLLVAFASFLFASTTAHSQDCISYTSNDSGQTVLVLNDAFPDDPKEICDTENDGIGDFSDNCPEISNPEQTDSDSDGIADACDEFPDDPGRFWDYKNSEINGYIIYHLPIPLLSSNGVSHYQYSYPIANDFQYRLAVPANRNDNEASDIEWPLAWPETDTSAFTQAGFKELPYYQINNSNVLALQPCYMIEEDTAPYRLLTKIQKLVKIQGSTHGHSLI